MSKFKTKNKLLAFLLAIITCATTGCSLKKALNVEAEENNHVNETNTPILISTPVHTGTPLILIPTPIPTATVEKGKLIISPKYKVVNTGGVNMRLGASKESLKIGQAKKGDKCTCIAEYEDWSLVQLGQTLCFIKSEFLDTKSEYDLSYMLTEEYDIVYATSKVNFRYSPEINDYNRISTIPKKAEIRVIGKTDNGFYLAKYDGKIGYVSTKYTDSLKARVVRNNSEVKDLKVQAIGLLKKTANLLENPNSKSNKITSLKVYQSVELLDEFDNYYLAKTGKTVGYISKKSVEKLSSPAITVDLSEQRLKVYVDGDVAVNTLVSTGKKGSETPVGLYKIGSKTKGRYLKGPGYKVWVDYWMGVKGDIGIHDMDNREMGVPHSHGCISCKKKAVSRVFEICPSGTPVNIEH